MTYYNIYLRLVLFDPAFAVLPKATKTPPQIAFEMLHDTKSYQYFEKHPEKMEIFQKAITHMSICDGNAIVKVAKEFHLFDEYSSFIDVAGGHGQLMKMFKSNSK